MDNKKRYTPAVVISKSGSTYHLAVIVVTILFAIEFIWLLRKLLQNDLMFSIDFLFLELDFGVLGLISFFCKVLYIFLLATVMIRVSDDSRERYIFIVSLITTILSSFLLLYIFTPLMIFALVSIISVPVFFFISRTFNF